MLYIRTNMNSTIATGHVMRCLSIADAAKELGEEVTFILSDTQAVSYISEKGCQTIILNRDWNDLESELSILKSVILKNQISSILVDSYEVTEGYLRELSKLTKVIYIDDLNRFIYPVNMLICYANYFEKFEYPQNYVNTKLCLGTMYMPLRKVFANIPKKQIKEKTENLLLLSGGNDEYHTLLSILEAIDTSAYKKGYLFTLLMDLAREKF